ncbi:hypothetical protein GCM10020255_004650 [Rhodococcus baikonurensis]
MPTPEPDFSLRGHQLAYPAARTIVSVDQGRGSYDLDDARTVQTRDPATKIGPVAGLIVEDVEARQVALPTSTHQRLQRRKGNAPGGPFTETVLEPGTVFEIRFRLADHVSDPEKVLDTLESVLTRPGLQIGSSAHAAYGGDLTLVSFTYAENEPWSDAPTDTAADEPVHLALVTPALVRNTHTGEHDPAALPAAVTANLSRIFGNALGRPVSVTIATGLPPSIGSTRIGGFDRGYRGFDPNHGPLRPVRSSQSSSTHRYPPICGIERCRTESVNALLMDSACCAERRRLCGGTRLVPNCTASPRSTERRLRSDCATEPPRPQSITTMPTSKCYALHCSATLPPGRWPISQYG